ncbi:MAG: 50S ribosomal protein L15 [Planctomycetia bacterium]|nr:50S ribosomal protein L15 [Planctomycetia bacterium]
MDISTVNQGVNKKKSSRRVGRGPGSGQGKTAGRGSNGQGSRAGFSMSPAFEGGQMPLARRIPKRGFNNKEFAEPVEAVTLANIVRYFDGTQVITPELLREKGLISGKRVYVKIIGNCELDKKFDFEVHAVSKGSAKLIEQAGGKIGILPKKKPVVKNKMKVKAKKA